MPTNILTDAEIAALLAERKELPSNYVAQLQRWRHKRGHDEGVLRVSGQKNSRFRIIIRKGRINPLDFSVILGYEIPRTNVIFRLRRYNGNTHFHTNKIEGERFFAFHIHMATERYQLLGMKEDAYAEATNRFSDWRSALACLFEDCGFVFPPNFQPLLLEWGL